MPLVPSPRRAVPVCFHQRGTRPKANATVNRITMTLIGLIAGVRAVFLRLPLERRGDVPTHLVNGKAAHNRGRRYRIIFTGTSISAHDKLSSGSDIAAMHVVEEQFDFHYYRPSTYRPLWCLCRTGRLWKPLFKRTLHLAGRKYLERGGDATSR